MANDFGSDYLVLEDEDGVEKEFEILDAVETDDARYVAVMPLPEDGQEESEDDEVYILRVETDENGDDLLVTIDDDAEMERVSEIFYRRMEEPDGEADGEEEV